MFSGALDRQRLAQGDRDPARSRPVPRADRNDDFHVLEAAPPARAGNRSGHSSAAGKRPDDRDAVVDCDVSAVIAAATAAVGARVTVVDSGTPAPKDDTDHHSTIAAVNVDAGTCPAWLHRLRPRTSHDNRFSWGFCYLDRSALRLGCDCNGDLHGSWSTARRRGMSDNPLRRRGPSHRRRGPFDRRNDLCRPGRFLEVDRARSEGHLQILLERVIDELLGAAAGGYYQRYRDTTGSYDLAHLSSGSI